MARLNNATSRDEAESQAEPELTTPDEATTGAFVQRAVLCSKVDSVVEYHVSIFDAPDERFLGDIEHFIGAECGDAVDIGAETCSNDICFA
jgi:hypothetical protein